MFWIPLLSCVIMHLGGQFGNQLFQVAAAVALAEKNRCPLCFPIFSQLRNPAFAELNFAKNYETIFRFIPNRLPRVRGIHKYYQPLYFEPIPYRSPCIELFGSFQSEKYFKGYEDRIRQLFAPPPQIESYLRVRFADLIAHPKTVAVHVRTGFPDYVKGTSTFYQLFLPPDLAFFKKAIEHFDADSLFVVFSDCPSWCKRNFQGIDRKLLFIEGQDYLYDFYLLSKCKHAIIANSTFGWWAAYLNTNPDKQIVCRRPFLPTAELPQGSEDIICDGWIPIDMPIWPPAPDFSEELAR